MTQEVIDLELDTDTDDEYEDRLREDVYEDYDELADFAVTAASGEPPPPGTRPLQEELLTLITETTVSGISINKDEVVAWLRNEEAALTGESSQIVPHRYYPSPPSSRGHDKYCDSEYSNHSRSPRSPARKKSRVISSVVVRQSNREGSHDRRRRSHHSSRRRSDEEKRRSHHDKRDEHRQSHHNWTASRNGSSRARSHRSPIRSHDDSRSHRSPIRSHDDSRSHRSPIRSHDDSRSHRSPIRSHRSPIRSRHTSPDRRQVIGIRRQVTVSPRKSDPRPSRKVKVQHRIDDDSETPQYKDIRSSTKPRDTPRATNPNKQNIRDARELLHEKRSAVPVTQYIKTLKDQIRNSEENAKFMFRELQTAKKDLLQFLRDAEEVTRDSKEEAKRDERRDKERVRKDEERRRKEQHTERRNGKSSDRRRDDRRRSRSDEELRKSHGTRKVTPERRRSSPNPEEGSKNPKDWIVLRPSEVAEFKCGGPAIFVQNISKSVSKKFIFSYFSRYGNIMDVAKLQLGKRKRTYSICVIFSRQSEADRVLEMKSKSHKSVEIDIPTQPNTFDLLLNALKQDPAPRDSVAVVQ